MIVAWSCMFLFFHLICNRLNNSLYLIHIEEAAFNINIISYSGTSQQFSVNFRFCRFVRMSVMCFDRAKRINTKFKKLVFGFIRNCQWSLSQDASCYQIHESIQWIILLFFYHQISWSFM